MNAFSQMLPAIGQTVEALHPGNEKEALKIRAGTALVQALIASLQQAHTESLPGPVPPATDKPADHGFGQ